MSSQDVAQVNDDLVPAGIEPAGANAQSGTQTGTQTEALTRQVELLQAELVRAQHDVLTTRDHIIGLESENVRLQAVAERLGRRVTMQHNRLQKLRTKLRVQERRTHRAERKLKEVLASRAWRVGRVLTRTKTPGV